MPRQLKIYRTPIGFHDAYVAAPSQKAALEVWGTDANLFARGAAEVVTDPDLTKEPLAKPGEIIKRLRGTDDEHLAALPKDKPKRPAAGKVRPPAKPKAPKKPRPSRRPVEQAEEELAEAQRQFADRHDELRQRERALTDERRQLERQEADEMDALQGAIDEAEKAYRKAVAAWER